ncbi:MAG: STAS domain-containing protein, partial [Paracoccaceae bacterium]
IALMGAVSFGVLQGVVIAIIATFIYVTLNAMQPRVVLLGRLPGRKGFYKLHRSSETMPIEGLTICFIQGSVLFVNSDHVKAQLDGIIDSCLPDCRWLVIDASAITQIDTTGTDMLLGIRDRLQRHGIVMAFAEVQSNVAAILKRAGLSGEDGSTPFFDDVEDAFHAFQSDSNPELTQDAEAEGRSDVSGTTEEERS